LDGEIDTVLDYHPTPQIKVVRSIKRNQNYLGGRTKIDSLNSVIAVFGFDSFGNQVYVDFHVWAHEFGHMCGLHEVNQNDCAQLIMRDDPLSQLPHDAITPAEADTIFNFLYLNGQNNATYCDATGAAALEDKDAIAGSGGVRITFATRWEANTASFVVRRVDPTTGAIYTVGSPTGAQTQNHKTYSISDPAGVSGSVYQIVEHQQSGFADLFYGPLIATTPTQGGGDGLGYNADSLAAVVASYDDGLRDPGPDPCSNHHPIRGYPVFEILCPDSFASTLESYASLWRNRGVNAEVISKTFADSCSGGYRGWIQWAATRFTTSFLLVGDANDHVMWDDPTRWTNGWSFPMTSDGGPSLHTASQPEKDLIPTFYAPVTDPPDRSWTYWTPYYSTDLPYADLDSDSLPDVIVGRLPASSIADVNAYTSKLAMWLTNTQGSFGTSGAIITRASPHGVVPVWPTAVAADSLRSSFPPGTNLIDLRDVSWVEGPRYQPTAAELDSLNLLQITAMSSSGVIAWNHDASDRYNWAGIRSQGPKGPHPGVYPPIPNNSRPFVSVALTCATNNFDETEHRDSLAYDPGSSTYRYFYPIRPLVEKLLFDPTGGAIAQVGPTRASFVEGNPLFGEEFIRQLYAPGASVGRAFLLAQRICMEHFPTYRDLFKSYVLLGDPRLGPNVVTAVAETHPPLGLRLSVPTPNPFNPTTRLRFYLDHPTVASITVFDVHGRVVRRLIPNGFRAAGWAETSWDGLDDHGHGVGRFEGAREEVAV
jgi:hypothetical protein